MSNTALSASAADQNHGATVEPEFQKKPHLGLRIHRLLDRILRSLENSAAIVAATVMLVMMLLISADATMRYLFHKPLLFQFTLTEEYLLIALVSLSLSWGFRMGGYIRIRGLVNALPPRLGHLLIRVGLLASCGYIAMLGWTAGKEWVSLFVTGETKIGVLEWPVHWSWIWIPIGCGLLTLRLLLVALGPVGDLDQEYNEGDVGEVAA